MGGQSAQPPSIGSPSTTPSCASAMMASGSSKHVSSPPEAMRQRTSGSL